MTTKETSEPIKDPSPEGLSEVMPWPYLRLTKQGDILYANTHFERMLETTCSELQTQKIDQLFYCETQELKINELIETISPAAAWHGRWIHKHEQKTIAFEIMIRVDPNNENIRWGIVLENPVVNNEAILSKRRELRLLQTLLDHTPDYLYFINTTGHFMISNKAFQRAIGVPYPGYEIGKRLGEFVCDETRRQFSTTDQRTLESHEPQINHVSFFRLKDDKGHWVQTTKMPVFDLNNECIGLVCILRDITQLKETTKKMRQSMRSAEVANQAKSEFLANMSHEIRTPINGIMGMTELCIETEINEEQKEYLDSVLCSSQTLLKIINDILDFSKIEARRMDLESIPFALHDCLHEVVAHMRPMASSKKIKLSLVIDQHCPRYVEGDPTRFKQILYNLINNAIKFTQKGFVSVSIKPTEKEFPEHNIELKVSDSGIGIHEQRKQQIFDSFTQADTSTTRRYGGTGLGLSICSRIVSLMAGEIILNSAVGKGSTFTVNLPLKSTTRPKPKPTSEDNTPYRFSALEILLVEDNPVNQETAHARLSKMGHHVVIAENGAEAIELYKSMRFDLVFMDIQMPDMDGITATHKLREIEHSRDSRTPIVAMSARASRDNNKECEEAGMDGYITKPFTSQIILETLHDLGFQLQDTPDVNDSHSSKTTVGNFTSHFQSLNMEDRLDLASAAQIYLDEYKKDCSMLMNAINSLDRPQIEYYAHRIRGGCSALGDTKVADAALWLEDHFKEASKESLFPHAQVLAQSMDSLAQEIRDTI